MFIFQLNKEAASKAESDKANGFIEKSPIYVTSYPPEFNSQTTTSTTSNAGNRVTPTTVVTPSTSQTPPAPVTNGDEPDTASEIELKQELEIKEDNAPRRSSSPFTNGRTEVLIGQDASSPDTRVKTTAIVENHRVSGLTVADDCVTR